jgi:hypothetical protein
MHLIMKRCLACVTILLMALSGVYGCSKSFTMDKFKCVIREVSFEDSVTQRGINSEDKVLAKADTGHTFLKIVYEMIRMEESGGGLFGTSPGTPYAYVMDSSGQKYDLKFTGIIIGAEGPILYTMTFGPLPKESHGFRLFIPEKSVEIGLSK